MLLQTRFYSSLVLVVMVRCTMVNPPDLGEEFRQCALTQPQTLGTCLGVGAINRLQYLDNNPEFELVDGVTLMRNNDQEYREEFSAPAADPSSFRSIVDTFNYVFSRRNTHFNMDFLYPGLGMQLVPSGAPGGMLEFVLDPHREAVNAHSLKEAGTGTILARQFVLPFILGLKFKIATILPIIFGIIALIAKKAIILSKIALVVSSALGLATLIFGSGAVKYQGQYYQGHQQFNPGFGGHYKYPEEDYQNVAYRSPEMNDQFKYSDEFYDRDDKKKGRNFAWSDDEKTKKLTT